MDHTIVIKENYLFRRLYNRGKYQAHPLLVTYALKNRLPYNRYGITASKKIGGAVERNRVKRIIRAGLSEARAYGELKTGYLVVIAAKVGAHEASSKDIATELICAFEKLKMYKTAKPTENTEKTQTEAQTK